MTTFLKHATTIGGLAVIIFLLGDLAVELTPESWPSVLDSLILAVAGYLAALYGAPAVETGIKAGMKKFKS